MLRRLIRIVALASLLATCVGPYLLRESTRVPGALITVFFVGLGVWAFVGARAKQLDPVRWVANVVYGFAGTFLVFFLVLMMVAPSFVLSSEGRHSPWHDVALTVGGVLACVGALLVPLYLTLVAKPGQPARSAGLGVPSISTELVGEHPPKPGEAVGSTVVRL